MRDLIVSEHAIKRGQERIPSLEGLSVQTIKRWYKENIPFSEKVPWGSRLYFRLERGNKEYGKKFLYFKDDFCIYIVEVIDEQKGFLHTVRELGDFGETPNAKLAELIDEEKIVDLVELRNSLRRSQKKSEGIQDLIA